VKTTKVNEPNTRLKPTTTPFVSWLKWGIPLLAFATVGVQWLWEPVQSGILLEEVPRSGQLDFLESRWTYFYLHLFTFFPVFFLSFDKNVHYYKNGNIFCRESSWLEGFSSCGMYFLPGGRYGDLMSGILQDCASHIFLWKNGCFSLRCLSLVCLSMNV
jgi:hypothetical protein